MRRRPAGWVPNQHGAWAMLILPLAVGALRAGPRWVHLWLLAAWLIGYLAFQATAGWLPVGPQAALPPTGAGLRCRDRRRRRALAGRRAAAAAMGFGGTPRCWSEPVVLGTPGRAGPGQRPADDRGGEPDGSGRPWHRFAGRRRLAPRRRLTRGMGAGARLCSPTWSALPSTSRR